MDEPQKVDDLLVEVKQKTELLSASLPSRVDAASISYTAKIPFKALDYRVALIWRIEELARIACEMYERNELTVAITLTRSCMEAAAAMWYVKENIEKVCNNKNIGTIDEKLIKLLIGSKDAKATPIEAIHIMEMIRSVKKKYKVFYEAYDQLSEYVHPNWAGVSLLYSKPVPENFMVLYGKNIRHKDETTKLGLNSLNITLLIFERSYNNIAELMPDFIKICEEHLVCKNQE